MRVVSKVLCFLMVAFIFAGASVSWACAGQPAPNCMDPWKIAPGPIPANTPAIAVIPSNGVTGIQNWELPPKIQLVQSGGSEVPVDVVGDARLGAWLVKPRSALSASSSFRVVFPELCDAPSSTKQTFESSFTTIGEHPLPTSAGRLWVNNEGLAREKVMGAYTTYPGMCPEMVEVDAYSVELQFEPSAELVRFLPVTYSYVKVDGHVWGQYSFGDIEEGSGPLTVKLLGVCSQMEGRRFDTSLASGAHRAVVETWLAGAAAPFTTSVDFEINCETTQIDEDPHRGNDEKGPSSPCNCSSTSTGSALAVGMLLWRVMMRRRPRSRS